MTWTLDLKISTADRTWALQHAEGAIRFGVERFPDGSRRVHLGPVEVSTWPRRGTRRRAA